MTLGEKVMKVKGINHQGVERYWTQEKIYEGGIYFLLY